MPVLAALLAACATAPPAAVAPASSLDRAVVIGRVLVMPQPSPADLDELAATGYGAVIDLRSEREIEQRLESFDEPHLVGTLGMDYRHAPISGADGYGPQQIEALIDALGDGDRRVVIHCASGARAAQLHAAWRVQVDGLSPTEALREMAAFGLWPLPLEQLTGIPLIVERAPR
ncbi:MAG TPA: sulfur transferase domain-containing protein [Xanthomonadaceae bacterium]|nr:sulfur transferase domain-containing protein [Xanthomonadaceae bacterium]